MAGAMEKRPTPKRPPVGKNGPNGTGGGTKTFKPPMPKQKRTGMK